MKNSSMKNSSMNFQENLFGHIPWSHWCNWKCGWSVCSYIIGGSDYSRVVTIVGRIKLSKFGTLMYQLDSLAHRPHNKFFQKFPQLESCTWHLGMSTAYGTSFIPGDPLLSFMCCIQQMLGWRPAWSSFRIAECTNACNIWRYMSDSPTLCIDISMLAQIKEDYTQALPYASVWWLVLLLL